MIPAKSLPFFMKAMALRRGHVSTHSSSSGIYKPPKEVQQMIIIGKVQRSKVEHKYCAIDASPRNSLLARHI